MTPIFLLPEPLQKRESIKTIRKLKLVTSIQAGLEHFQKDLRSLCFTEETITRNWRDQFLHTFILHILSIQGVLTRTTFTTTNSGIKVFVFRRPVYTFSCICWKATVYKKFNYQNNVISNLSKLILKKNNNKNSKIFTGILTKFIKP